MNQPTAMLDPKFKNLVAKIEQGDCVLVLGPRIAAPLQASALTVPMDDYFAGKLCDDLDQAAGAPEDLRRTITRYEREKGAAACRSLMQQLAGELGEHTTDLHLDLATLPFRLILAATPDRMMVQALRAQGKTHAREAYYDYCRSTSADVSSAKLTAEAPLVYSMFGRHDHPESMVLNDKNLLDYLVNITRESPALPDVVRATLRDSKTVFLFVGFGFANWWLRLLLKVLEVTGVENRALSLALEDSRAFDAASASENMGFFGLLGIDIQSRDLNALAKHLASSIRQTQAAQAALPAPAVTASDRFHKSPLVFLSYAREDEGHVELLRLKLAQRGITAWQDVQNLRAGQNWEDQINRVVKGADYFVFVQTENMDERERLREDGVYNRELKRALKRMEDKPGGTTFLFHVTVGNCRQRPEPELSELHRIAVDTDAGMEQLAKDIAASYLDTVPASRPTLAAQGR